MPIWRESESGCIGELADVLIVGIHNVGDIGPDKEGGLDNAKEDEWPGWEAGVGHGVGSGIVVVHNVPDRWTR